MYLNIMFDIEYHKTRISIWFIFENNNKSSSKKIKKRYAKIEYNKFSITYGFSNKKTENWDIYNFKKINECLNILDKFLVSKNEILLLEQKNKITEHYLLL